MKSLLNSAILSLIVFLGSCGPSPQEQNDQFRTQVIAVHDEVMPKMGQLKSLQKKALQKAEDLTAQDSTQTEQIQAYKTLALELDQAYEGMMVWMRQYEREDGDATPEEVKAYLDEQMILVQKVNDDIKNALIKADSLLKD